MRNVHIAGVGQTAVSKQTSDDVRELGARAVRAAVQNSGLEAPTALYVGNMLSGMLSSAISSNSSVRISASARERSAEARASRFSRLSSFR